MQVEEDICPPEVEILQDVYAKRRYGIPPNGHYARCEACRSRFRRYDGGDLEGDLFLRYPELEHGGPTVFQTDWGTIQ